MAESGTRPVHLAPMQQLSEVSSGKLIIKMPHLTWHRLWATKMIGLVSQMREQEEFDRTG